jgi:hypothetical protein
MLLGIALQCALFSPSNIQEIFIYIFTGIYSLVLVIPSHRVHEIVGRLICGFSDRAIDRIIDNSYKHDLSRMKCRELFNLASLVLEAYGEKGICYLVLHHYLDKLVSILRGRYIRLHLKRDFSRKSIVSEIRSGFMDEISVFSFLTRYRYFMDNPLLWRFYYRNTLIAEGYSKGTARRKANMLSDIAIECKEVLEEMQNEMMKNREQGRRLAILEEIIIDNVNHVTSEIFFNIEKILCIILTEERHEWENNVGKDIYNSITKNLECTKRI